MLVMMIAITSSLNASGRLELEIVKKEVVRKKNWRFRIAAKPPELGTICAQP
jgi:hypothetical protein